MKERLNAPELRFPGFTDDWEERKLGEITEVITKGSTPLDKSWSGPVNYVKTESINKDNGQISMTANTSLEEHENYLKRSKLKDGDLLFSIVGTLGRVGLVEEKDLPANTNQQISIIRLCEGDKYFLFNTLKTHRIISFIKSDATIGAQPSLSLWQIEGLSVPFPNVKEQVKIGSFFKQLDTTITLHQRKLDLLKEQKKGFLQKMFPKNGAKVPELRFAGFDDDWEERKLGDAVNISSGVTGDATLQNGKYRLTRIESISQGILNVARLGFTNEKPDQKYLLNLGDILYSNINSLSHIGKVALVDTTGIYHGINLLRFQMRNGVDSEFLFQRLNTMPMKNWAVSHANPAVSQASINQTELSKQPISSPTLTEQQQIGSFFKEIDNTIALHQRKLDLLKEQKKGYLQKMFI